MVNISSETYSIFIKNAFLSAEDESFDENSRLKILKKLEVKKEQLIKSGQMTPFGSVISHQDNKDRGEDTILNQKDQNVDSDLEESVSWLDFDESLLSQRNDIAGDLFGTKKRVRFAGKLSINDDSDDEYIPNRKEMEDSYLSGDQLSDSGRMEEDQGLAEYSKKEKHKKRRLNVVYEDHDSNRPAKKVKKKQNEKIDRKPMDDGNYKNYRERIRSVKFMIIIY